MTKRTKRVGRLGRHLTLLLSVGLILVLGVGGLWAGHAVGSTATKTRRADRLALQVTLAGLTGQYTQVAGAEILDIVGAQTRAGAPAWVGSPGSRSDAQRLRQAAVGSRALSAGAVLIAADGSPVSTYVPAGKALPSMVDAGWQPLRMSVLSGRKTLPVSGVLSADGTPESAVAIPVVTASGRPALLVGLADLRTGGLQTYVEHLRNIDGRLGYVVDGRGLVIGAPRPEEVGTPLRYPHVRTAVLRGEQGMLTVREGSQTLATSYARAGDSGWIALTFQDDGLFLGPLRSSSRRAEVALVALLLAAGVSLLILHRKREAALRDVAVSDELTGLYNRRGWYAVASHEIERARRGSERRGLLFFDLDGLKHINDALGHREGDRAIVDAAAVLRGVCRSADVLGRLGGDEFVLLLAGGVSPDEVRGRVLDALARHNSGSRAGFELRLSIGAEVWYPDDAGSLDELVQRADDRMYADKTSRPGRHDGLVREPELVSS